MMLWEVVFAHMVEGSTCQRFVGIVKKFQYDLVYPKRCQYLATERNAIQLTNDPKPSGAWMTEVTSSSSLSVRK
jgi:hypothetical protein